MVLFHYSAQIISRAAGKSAVAAAAYRAGEQLWDERHGKLYDYSRKLGVAHSEILLPVGASDWMAERQSLWNQIEVIEKHPRAQLCREFTVALQSELTIEQNIDLLRGFLQERFVSQGMVVDFAVHYPLEQDGRGGKFCQNPHAHVMYPLRLVKDEGFGKKKQGQVAQFQAELLEERETWARHVNAALRDAGVASQVDHRSLAEQGIERQPQIHLGVHANAMRKKALEQQSVLPERAEQLAEILEVNRQMARLKMLMQELAELTAAEVEVQAVVETLDSVTDKAVSAAFAEGAETATAPDAVAVTTGGWGESAVHDGAGQVINAEVCDTVEVETEALLAAGVEQVAATIVDANLSSASSPILVEAALSEDAILTTVVVRESAVGDANGKKLAAMETDAPVVADAIDAEDTHAAEIEQGIDPEDANLLSASSPIPVEAALAEDVPVTTGELGESGVMVAGIQAATVEADADLAELIAGASAVSRSGLVDAALAETTAQTTGGLGESGVIDVAVVKLAAAADTAETELADLAAAGVDQSTEPSSVTNADAGTQPVGEPKLSVAAEPAVPERQTQADLDLAAANAQIQQQWAAEIARCAKQILLTIRKTEFTTSQGYRLQVDIHLERLTVADPAGKELVVVQGKVITAQQRIEAHHLVYFKELAAKAAQWLEHLQQAKGQKKPQRPQPGR